MQRTEDGKEDGKRTRYGFTTGTCAAAAALAAAALLFEGEVLAEVCLTPPKGIPLRIKIAEAEAGEGFASCGVIKDAGDDPDVTDGVLVRVTVGQPDRSGATEGMSCAERPTLAKRLDCAEPVEGQERAEMAEPVEGQERAEMAEPVEGQERAEVAELVEGKERAEVAEPVEGLDCAGGTGPAGGLSGSPVSGRWYTYLEGTESRDPFSLYLRGGKGIGTVTKEGLSCPVGMWAINPVPRRMIFEQVASVCRRCFVSGPVYLTVEIPEGERLAEQTFNPRLGIVGGLSVLGTSGIVEPMSETALLETIRLEIRQKALEGQGRKQILLLTPGNYGERFAADHLGLSMAAGVKCSNHIGAAIDMAAAAGVERVLLVGHAGKLLKVAAGVMNTHSSMADGRMECLAAYGAACGADREKVRRILDCVTVDGALAVLEEAQGLREAVMAMAMERIDHHLTCRARGSLKIEALLFTNDRGVLGMTPGAARMVQELSGTAV